MVLCSRGDVVLIPVPFDDYTAFKARPCVVLSVTDLRVVICPIHSFKDKHKFMTGIKLLKDSPEGRQMSLLEDSFINTWDRVVIKPTDVLKVIGSCPYMEKFS